MKDHGIAQGTKALRDSGLAPPVPTALLGLVWLNRLLPSVRSLPPIEQNLNLWLVGKRTLQIAVKARFVSCHDVQESCHCATE